MPNSDSVPELSYAGKWPVGNYHPGQYVRFRHESMPDVPVKIIGVKHRPFKVVQLSVKTSTGSILRFWMSFSYELELWK